MRSRIAICLGGLALVCLALASGTTAQNGDIPRTPSGRPDLSGTYDVATLTPMERPTELGEKMALSEEEAAEIAEGALRRNERRNRPSDPNRGAPEAATTRFRSTGSGARRFSSTRPTAGIRHGSTALTACARAPRTQGLPSGSRRGSTRRDHTTTWSSVPMPSAVSSVSAPPPAPRCCRRSTTTTSGSCSPRTR